MLVNDSRGIYVIIYLQYETFSQLLRISLATYFTYIIRLNTLSDGQ